MRTIQTLLKQIQKECPIWRSRCHGITHWERVEKNGLLLAEITGADRKVVSYFAYLHDCQRCNEFDDPQHGPRAANFALKHRSLVDLNDEQFDLLLRACSGHTFAMPHGKAGSNTTLAACWDADRLDIDRVGIEIDPAYLFLSFSKELAA